MYNEMVVADLTSTPGQWEPSRVFATRGPAWWRRALERWAPRLGLRGEWKGPRVRQIAFQRPDGDWFQRLMLCDRSLEQVYNQRAKYLFVGPAAFDEALRYARTMSLGAFDLEVYGPRGWKVCGIEVVLVPWMEGSLLVPDWTQ